MITTDPISLATRGVYKTDGNSDPLGIATAGVVNESAGVPFTGLEGLRRTQLLTLMGRYRR
jgi:hypothetical protein